MHGTPEFQIPAKTYGKIFKTAAKLSYRHQIGERLRRVEVASVARIYDRTRRKTGCEERRTFFRTAHRDDVDVRRNDADRIGKRFPFYRGTRLRVRKSLDRASETEHRRFEGKTRARARFKKKRRENFPAAHILKRCRIDDHLFGKRADFIDLFDGKIIRLYKMASFQHANPPLLRLSSAFALGTKDGAVLLINNFYRHQAPFNRSYPCVRRPYRNRRPRYRTRLRRESRACSLRGRRARGDFPASPTSCFRGIFSARRPQVRDRRF